MFSVIWAVFKGFSGYMGLCFGLGRIFRVYGRMLRLFLKDLCFLEFLDVRVQARMSIFQNFDIFEIFGHFYKKDAPRPYDFFAPNGAPSSLI